MNGFRHVICTGDARMAEDLGRQILKATRLQKLLLRFVTALTRPKEWILSDRMGDFVPCSLELHLIKISQIKINCFFLLLLSPSVKGTTFRPSFDRKDTFKVVTSSTGAVGTY